MKCTKWFHYVLRKRRTEDKNYVGTPAFSLALGADEYEIIDFC